MWKIYSSKNTKYRTYRLWKQSFATREPGGSEGAEEIRNLLLTGNPDRWSAETEILLFTAARRDHLERTILPALQSGTTVICDRFQTQQGFTKALRVVI